jgi:putative transposase
MKNTKNILALVQNILGAKLSHLFELSKSYWAHTGKFSLTNLSRWTLSMSKRRIERFYAQPHDWVSHNICVVSRFFERFSSALCFISGDWVLTVDETVDKKSGKSTYGRGYHYSSKVDKLINSVAVLNLSLTHSGTKLSLPLIQEQLVHPTEKTPKQLAKKKQKQAAKVRQKARQKALSSGKMPVASVVSEPLGKKVGRPKGSKNKTKSEKEAESPDIAYTFRVFQSLLLCFVQRIAPLLSRHFKVKHVVGDGGFGNNTVAKICLDLGFDLISKLQYNAALYLPFVPVSDTESAPEQDIENGKKRLGRTKKYGDKINYDKASEQLKAYLVEKRVAEDGSIEYMYHIKKCLHKSFEMPLNILIIVPCDKKGQPKVPKSRRVLFSTDLNADYKTIDIKYHVRFQIEFNFRDARQYFGLSHFKNIKKQQVENVIGYAFFMVTLSNIVLFELKQDNPNCPLSIQDLKAVFRAEKYFNELLNTPQFKHTQFLNQITIDDFPIIGSIASTS